MLWNSLLLAVRAIRRNVLRSFLTILGVVIGVASVIVMVTLGDGATQSVKEQMQSLGANLLMVRPGMRMGPGRNEALAPNFKMADVEALAEQITAAQAVVPTASATVTVVYGNKNWQTNATGSTAAYFQTNNWRLAGGRFFTEAEALSGRAACVIGSTVRRELYGTESPVGTEMRVKSFSCEVVGLLASKGQGGMGMDADDTIIIPLRTLQRRVRGNDDVTGLQVAVKEGSSVDVVIAQIKSLLRERRKITEGEDDNFTVFDTRQIADTLSSMIRTLTMLLGSVAAISLLVGGIGIMNIMLVSVTERTREIGIRLAIGAVESEVLSQFLIEAVALSSFGGLIGIVSANAIALGVTRLIDVPYLFNPGMNVVSFLFSALIGVVFGYFPAQRAAQLDPIEALRYE
jgi:putative ABC transport system permease protein